MAHWLRPKGRVTLTGVPFHPFAAFLRISQTACELCHSLQGTPSSAPSHRGWPYPPSRNAPFSTDSEAKTKMVLMMIPFLSGAQQQQQQIQSIITIK